MSRNHEARLPASCNTLASPPSPRVGLLPQTGLPGKAVCCDDDATLVIELLFAGVPASTPALVSRVREHRDRSPTEHAALMGRLASAAERAVRAAEASDASAFVEALRAQLDAFRELGRRAGAPIVIPEVERLAALAERESATVLPAGAGGGDVAIYAGLSPPSDALLHSIGSEGHTRLGLGLGARVSTW